MPAKPVTPPAPAPERNLRDPNWPIGIMLGFIAVLLSFAMIRLNRVDADKAQRRLQQHQARLAAESGVHQVIARLRGLAAEPVSDLMATVVGMLDQPAGRSRLGIDRWVALGESGATFRVVRVRSLPGLDRPDTPLIDEARRLAVETEGVCGGARATARAVVHLADLARSYAVVNSLNTFYQGFPWQYTIQMHGDLDGFIAEHGDLLTDGRMTLRGVIHDPVLLAEMYKPDGTDPFIASYPKVPNFGTRAYQRSGVSPAIGPLYCGLPMVVDDHTFFGPVHTAAWLYRRKVAVARIEMGQRAHLVRSSKRVQAAVGLSEADPPPHVFIDADTAGQVAWLEPWHPNLGAIRTMARREGLYIDARGAAFLRGEPFPMELHRRDGDRYSETYPVPLSIGSEQDVIAGPVIYLATEKRFTTNNLDHPKLQDVRVVFSELSVSIRGELAGSLAIVTPRKILITGSTNTVGRHQLFLVAGEGAVLDTEDLEAWARRTEPSPEVMAQANRWEVRAVIYKPGSGFTGSWAMAHRPGQPAVYPFDASRGQRVRVKVVGSCLEGDLERWHRHSLAPQQVDPRLRQPGIQVIHDPDAIGGLPLRPWSVNLSRLDVADTK